MKLFNHKYSFHRHTNRLSYNYRENNNRSNILMNLCIIYKFKYCFANLRSFLQYKDTFNQLLNNIY